MCTWDLIDIIPHLIETRFYYGLPTSELLDQQRNETVAIPHKMIRRVMDNFRERLRQCVNNNGKHLTDVIIKTK